MHAVSGHQARSIPNLVPRCLRSARDFLILSDRVHRWSVAVVTGTIAILIACFIRYAYVEKHHLTDSFFHGRLQFSFVDRGYPEIFGYGLELAACALFSVSAWVYRKKQWYAFAVILFVTFLDDAFELHEAIGRMFNAGLGLSPVVGDLIGFSLDGIVVARVLARRRAHDS